MGSFEELKQYKELLDSGIITQEEFEIKKKQLLEKMDADLNDKGIVKNIVAGLKVQPNTQKSSVEKNKKIIKTIIKLVVVLLCLVLCGCIVIKMTRKFRGIKKGDVVTFGTYKGKEIEWICVESKFNKALLVSKDVLDIKHIVVDNDPSSYKWKNTFLRKWLDKVFYKEAFSNKEQKIILTETIEKSNVNVCGTGEAYGPETEDKVFILSGEELRKLSDEEINCKYENEPCNYWVRTVQDWGDGSRYINWLSDEGCSEGDAGYPDASGVRPAIWVKK